MIKLRHGSQPCGRLFAQEVVEPRMKHAYIIGTQCLISKSDNFVDKHDDRSVIHHINHHAD